METFAMKWFRFYDEVLDDPKCQRLSPVMFKHWVNLLCLANRSSARGELPSLADLAFGLRLSEGKAKTVITELIRAELVDCRPDETLQIHGWSNRQRTSDNVADRVAKHRRETASVTLQDAECNVTETTPHVRVTETETETETEVGVPPTPPARAKAAPKPSGYSIEFEDFWRAYPSGHGVKKQAWEQWQRLAKDPATQTAIVRALDAWKASDRWQRGYVKDAQRWLKDRQWEDTPPPPPALVPDSPAQIRSIPARNIGLSNDDLERIARGEQLA